MFTGKFLQKEIFEIHLETFKHLSILVTNALISTYELVSLVEIG